MVNIPTLQQLYASAVSDIQTQLGVTVNPLGRSFLKALAWMMAGMGKLQYLAIGDVQKNIFPDTAGSEQNGGTLERFGRVKLGRNPNPAQQGVYTVSVTGTNGVVIPASTTFQSDDGSTSPGAIFVLDSAYTFAGTSGSISLRALTAGTAARLLVGDTLTATSPLLNADEAATVTAITTAPVDAETIEEYRAVVLQAYRIMPQGGSAADYRLWGLDVAGVKQVYPYTAPGVPGRVDVYVEATVGASTDGKGTPPTAMRVAVANAIIANPITGEGRIPLGVTLLARDVVINNIDITIAGAGGITAAQRTLITQQIRDQINDTRPFIGGADVAADRRDTFSTYDISAAVAKNAPGAVPSGISMTITTTGPAVPATSKTFDYGNIPYLNSVTYA